MPKTTVQVHKTLREKLNVLLSKNGLSRKDFTIKSIDRRIYGTKSFNWHSVSINGFVYSDFDPVLFPVSVFDKDLYIFVTLKKYIEHGVVHAA